MPTFPGKRHRLAIRVFDRLTVGRAVAIILVIATGLTFLLAWLEHRVEPETFPDYGIALWFAISTVTTTGYGDVVPETGAGRMVASVIMLMSLALVPLLTSVVVSALVVRTQQRRAELEAAGVAIDEPSG